MRYALPLFALVAACTAPPGPDPDLPAAICDPGATVVTLTTADDIELEADLVRVEEAIGAVALFHMIPPGNTRANYPQGFVDALTARGLHVINVDRRGAGSSGGTARDAFEGPLGKNDVHAAIEALTTGDCASDKIALVGASNGTTSIVDATVDGADVDALVLLTPGNYTENQNSIDDIRSALDDKDVLFNWDSNEGAVDIWIEPIRSTAPASTWTFDERSPGGHGTLMFNADPATVDFVADYIKTALSSQ